MLLPFGLGFAIAWGIYNQFRDEIKTESIGFGVFGLFIGTALAITAFPVLCRILTELNLLRSNVGVTVLAAGIGNDVTGWILLALCVALVNNGSGLAALWALLCCIGWTLLLVFGIRPPFIWVLRRTGSLQNGPTQGMVALTLLMVLASAWFTGKFDPFNKKFNIIPGS
jgi:Kef-type K+ transport system membrane component KefB